MVRTQRWSPTCFRRAWGGTAHLGGAGYPQQQASGAELKLGPFSRSVVLVGRDMAPRVPIRSQMSLIRPVKLHMPRVKASHHIRGRRGSFWSSRTTKLSVTGPERPKAAQPPSSTHICSRPLVLGKEGTLVPHDLITVTGEKLRNY